MGHWGERDHLDLVDEHLQVHALQSRYSTPFSSVQHGMHGFFV